MVRGASSPEMEMPDALAAELAPALAGGPQDERRSLGCQNCVEFAEETT